MDRLHQVIRAVVLSVFAGLPGLAADYCSLTVRVLSPDHRRPLEVLVSVQERSGRVVEKETKSQDLPFCDLGITPVTVTVGSDVCNQVIVRDVPLEWREQYVLAVTYDPEPCMPERPPVPVPVCQVLFRVSDAQSRWIEKASIYLQDPGHSTMETDSAGRAVQVLKVGERLMGRVGARGYVSRSFSISCPRSEQVHEEHIKLVKGP